MKTKLECLKDLATAIQGLKANTEAVYKLADENLGQDYGLWQVKALLELAYRELNREISICNRWEEAIQTNPDCPL